MSSVARIRQLNLKDLFLVTVIAALFVLVYSQRQRLEEREAEIGQLHRRAPILPHLEIQEPRIFGSSFRQASDISIQGSATIPETMLVSVPAMLEIELIECQSGKTVVTQSTTTFVHSDGDSQRLGFNHKMKLPAAPSPGAHLIVVHLLNKDKQRAAKCITAIQIVSSANTATATR